MKTLTLIFALCLLPFALSAQLTNGVKVSALPSASTPLTGNELVPLVQVGATKSATVAQIIAAPVAANTATSNKFTAEIAAATANNLTTSNALKTLNTATSNKFTVDIATDTANNLATSNTLTAAVAAQSAKTDSASNALTTAIIGKYGTNNPAGYQTAAEVTAAVTAAVGNVLTNASLTASNLNLAVVDLGSYTNNGSTPLIVNLARGSFQTVRIPGNSSTLYLSCTNIFVGQNVTLVISNAYSSWVNTYTDGVMRNYNNSGNSLGQVQQNKTMICSFFPVGTNRGNVICSAAFQK